MRYIDADEITRRLKLVEKAYRIDPRVFGTINGIPLLTICCECGEFDVETARCKHLNLLREDNDFCSYGYEREDD